MMVKTGAVAVESLSDRAPRVQQAVRPALTPKTWAVVLAGGEGGRLRPLVRRLFGDERPKQDFGGARGPGDAGKVLNIANAVAGEEEIAPDSIQNGKRRGRSLAQITDDDMPARVDEKQIAAAGAFPAWCVRLAPACAR